MTILLFVLLVVAAAILGALAMRWWTETSLARISHALRSLAGGDFSARIQPRPSGPAGDLSDDFQDMVTGLRRLLAEASQGSNRLAAALNSSIDGVAAVDAQGRIVFANPALERLLDPDAVPTAGNPFVWLLPDQQVLDAIRASREQGEHAINLIERPGRRFLQVVTTPIQGGGDWSVLVVVHDLTDVRRAELSRRDFVANVSHELRTPVAALRAVIETLADGAMQDKTVVDEFLRRADTEAQRLVLLVEELLELSRIESGELPLAVQPTDVTELVHEAVELLRAEAERRGINLVTELGDGLESLPIDPSRFDRALVNLLQNAVKFTPEGGTVTVKAQHEGDELQVHVTDTGIGIAANDLPRVFERFYKVDQSRASGGSGLGLALVKHAVEAHGGSVQAESRIGEGSTFSFVIPLAKADDKLPS